ncbi:MAG: hypothetical protein LBS43_07435 [Prevotellaceae bacterium]|jgi:hypothetical protein|nr:hypothetical protein [Prevotellaceae bacterium]
MANITFCGTSGGNVGLPRCDVKMNTPIAVIFAPRDAKISKSDADDLIALIKAKSKDDSSLLRWYPVVGIEQITDSSEEPVTGNLAATGYTEKLRDGATIYLFEYPARLCKAKALKQFDQWDGGVCVISNDKKLWGRVTADGSLAPYLPSSVAVYGGGFNDGQNVITSKLQINFGQQGQFIEESGFFGFEEDDDISGLTGLQNLVIAATGTNKFSVTTKCDRVNLFDLYADELADVDLWKVTKASDGSAVTVSAATKNATTKDFTVTFTAPTVKYYVSLAAVSDLEAKGIVGYESGRLTVNP